jgi:dihydroflavonol-4-reductase
MWQVNVEGTEQLLVACWRARIERVIHCSTAGILFAAGRLVRDSDFPAKPPKACHYKQSKWHGERNALAWVARGLPVVIASPTVPIGAGDERPTPSGRMFLDLLRGRFPACSRTGLNVIAVEDLAEGLLAAERAGEVGNRYVLGHENIWVHELLALAAELAGRPAPRAVVPLPLVALGGLLGEAWGLLTRARNNRLCWETAYFARQRQFFDVTQTQTALNWQPRIPIRVAVGNAVAWFAGFTSERRTVLEVPRQSPVSS